ncbi:MAG: hypothetical protein H6740_13925 [Alphaproteobacteria bacterium]|nr:hypothetical protein [Alphaproteobacteria bacterium]
MLATLLLSSLALAGSLRGEPIEKTLPANMPTLHIVDGVGSVKVRVDPRATETRVRIQPITWAEGCDVELSGDATRAEAKVLREGEDAGLACRTRFEVTLAAGTELAVDLGAGRVKMEDLEDPVDVHVGLGGVKLRYARPPEGAVAANVGLGRVRAHFPYGTWLDLSDTDAKVGFVRSAIPAREDAETELDAVATVGRVRVKTILIPWEESPWSEPSPPAVASAD